MNMKTDCFYVFENKPVAIISQRLQESSGRWMAKVRHIMRRCDKHGNILDKDDIEEVFCDKLQELTPNIRIHAFNDCLAYMD